MRFLILFATACATTYPRPTTPLRYECADGAYTWDGDRLATGSAALERRDDRVFAASHDSQLVEITLPEDPRRDAVERVFASPGVAVRTDVCRVHGGYSDLLARYLNGESIDQIAREHTNGDRDTAYLLVHHGMLALQRQLFRDR